MTLYVDDEAIEFPVDEKDDEGEVSDEYSNLDEEQEEGTIVAPADNLTE